MRRISDGLVISSWTFADGGKAVAYSEGTAHFSAATIYRLRGVADGRVLAKYECSLERGVPPGQPARPERHGEVPAWVWPIAGDCPAR